MGGRRKYKFVTPYAPVVRITRIIGVLILFGVALGTSVSAFAQSSEDAIVVIEVSDPIDQRIIDYITTSLETEDVHAFILKIDSPGVSSGELAPLYEAVVEAGAPVISWIGPSPAVAYGGAAFLANHADIRSAAPGSKVGLLDPAVQRSGENSPSVRSGDDPQSFLSTATVLADATATATVGEPVIDGFVDRVDPALGQLVVSLDGSTVVKGDQTFTLDTATTRTIGDQQVVVASRPVRFIQSGLIDRLLRLGARPETAFLFLLFALAFGVFEFYAAGSGLMAFVGGLAMIVAGYGFATLPIWWPAVGMVIAGVAFLVWGFIQNRVGWRAALGGALVLVGGLTFTSTRPAYPPAVWLVGLASLASSLFIWYSLTTVVRGRFATPTVGRENLLGRRCVVVSELSPGGVVLLDGARWRATADRGIQIAPGAPVEIVGVIGLILEVDPLGAPAAQGQ